MPLTNFIWKDTGEKVNGSSIKRSDTREALITVVDPNQTGATLRFVAKDKTLYPNGSPLIVKSGIDFIIDVTPAGNVLTARMIISKVDTTVFLEKIALFYELERSVANESNEQITTLEFGMLTVIPDIATNL